MIQLIVPFHSEEVLKQKLMENAAFSFYLYDKKLIYFGENSDVNIYKTEQRSGFITAM
jgi:hypothetical protein